MNCRFVIICFALFLNSSLLLAQKISTRDFMQQIFESKNSEQEVKDYKSPWLESLDFRTETNEFQLDQQEFRIRIAPNTPRLMNARKEWIQSLEEGSLLENERYQNLLFLNAFDSWQSLAILQRTLQLLDKKHKLLEDQLFVLSNEIENPDSDPLDILSLENTVENTISELERTKAKDQIIRTKYTINLSDSLTFDDLLKIDDLEQIVAGLERTNALFQNSLTVYELEMNKREVALEKAERYKYFDFLQLNYGSPYRQNVQEGLSVALGFTIPIGDNSKVKLKELEIERRSIMQEISQDSLRMETEIGNLVFAFNQEIKSYRRYITFQKNTERKSRSLEQELRGNETTLKIMQILKLKAYAVDVQLNLIKKEQGIREFFSEIIRSARFTDMQFLSKRFEGSSK